MRQNLNQAGKATGRIFNNLLNDKEGKISILTSNKEPLPIWVDGKD